MDLSLHRFKQFPGILNFRCRINYKVSGFAQWGSLSNIQVVKTVSSFINTGYKHLFIIIRGGILCLCMNLIKIHQLDNYSGVSKRLEIFSEKYLFYLLTQNLSGVIMKKFFLSSITMTLLVLMYSCSEVAPVQQAQNDATRLNLGKKSVSNTSGVAQGSYLILGQGNKLPKNLTKSVANLNGSLIKTIPEIGIAIVQSDAPDFQANAAEIAGIQSVVPNLTTQWLDPNMRNVSIDADFGNPPASGDDDFYFDLQWGHDAVDAPEAWELGYRGAGVRVGVLDTGFDLDHPDLAPNINFALSYDFTGEGLQYALPDPFSHGTHTAGTIAAADNGFGTIGVAPEAELVLIKVLGDAGSGSFGNIISGIIYAALADADVINMSIGATLEKSGNAEDGYTARDVAELKNALGRAVTFAYQSGTTVITSAGNEATDYDHSADLIHLPSGVPHALSISATAPIGWVAVTPSPTLDFPASYSNYGQSAIDFAAPGGDYVYPGNESSTVAGITRPTYVFDFVFSTGNGSWYWSVGTSMASPHAAGVAALIIGKNGGSMPPAQVEAAMRSGADDLGKPGNDDYYGAGRVNAYNSVK